MLYLGDEHDWTSVILSKFGMTTRGHLRLSRPVSSFATFTAARIPGRIKSTVSVSKVHSKGTASITGWWFQPLWRIWKSIGMLLPIDGNRNKTCSKPPTSNHVMACRYPEVAPLEGLPLLQQKPQNSKPWHDSAILLRCLKSWHQARSRFVAGSRSQPLLPQRWGWFFLVAWQGRSLMVSRSCFFISYNETVSTNGTLLSFHLQILVNLQTHVWFTVYPRWSMYGIFTNIYPIYISHV